MNNLNKLIDIARRKAIIDNSNDWSTGSSTYLSEIIKEIEEVKEELNHNRLCFLEDELADVLWDYINILLNLETERDVNIGSVIDRACNKYDERIYGLENGISWDEIKSKQKIELKKENAINIENTRLNV